MNRQLKLRVFLLTAIAMSTAASALAQSPAYPVRPVRMIIALAPGGGVDTTGRFLAQKFTEAWGVSVVPDNRPGAVGTGGQSPARRLHAADELLGHLDHAEHHEARL